MHLLIKIKKRIPIFWPNHYYGDYYLNKLEYTLPKNDSTRVKCSLTDLYLRKQKCRFLCPAMKWNRSVIPSSCQSVIIHFPIIIWTIVAHIQLEFNILMYLINSQATYEFSFGSLIFDEVMPLELWKKVNPISDDYFNNHCLYLTQI